MHDDRPPISLQYERQVPQVPWWVDLGLRLLELGVLLLLFMGGLMLAAYGLGGLCLSLLSMGPDAGLWQLGIVGGVGAGLMLLAVAVEPLLHRSAGRIRRRWEPPGG